VLGLRAAAATCLVDDGTVSRELVVVVEVEPQPWSSLDGVPILVIHSGAGANSRPRRSPLGGIRRQHFRCSGSGVPGHPRALASRGNTTCKYDIMTSLNQPLYGSVRRWSALGVVCLGVLGLGGTGAESSAVIRASADVAVVKLSHDGMKSKVTTIDCAGTPEARRTCAQLFDVKPRRTERCFQMWGGSSWAVIRMSDGREVTFTRANSCEIARWNRLQSLLHS
jgi:hypothetical protein